MGSGLSYSQQKNSCIHTQNPASLITESISASLDQKRNQGFVWVVKTAHSIGVTLLHVFVVVQELQEHQRVFLSLLVFFFSFYSYGDHCGSFYFSFNLKKRYFSMRMKTENCGCAPLIM